MCDLLLPLCIKGLSASSVFFSIDNFNEKNFLKTIFELRIKAKVSINVYINIPDLYFVFWGA